MKLKWKDGYNSGTTYYFMKHRRKTPLDETVKRRILQAE